MKRTITRKITTLNEKVNRDIKRTLNERAETNIKKIDWMELNELLASLKEQIEYDINPDLEYWNVFVEVDGGKAYIDIASKDLEDWELDGWSVEDILATENSDDFVISTDEFDKLKDKILAEKSKVITKIIPDLARQWGFRNIRESISEAVIDDDFKKAYISIRDMERDLLDYKKYHRKRNALQIKADQDKAWNAIEGITLNPALGQMFQNIMQLLKDEEDDCNSRVKREVRIKRDNKNEKGETISEKQWNDVLNLADKGPRPDREHRAVAVTLSDGEDKIFPNAASAIRALTIDREGSLDDTMRDPTKDGDQLYDVCEGHKMDRYGEPTFKGYPVAFASRYQIEQEMKKQGFTPKTNESYHISESADSKRYVIDLIEYALFNEGVDCSDLIKVHIPSKMFDENGNIKWTPAYDLSQVDIDEFQDGFFCYYISLIDMEDASRAHVIADKLGFDVRFVKPTERRPKDYYNYLLEFAVPYSVLDMPIDQFYKEAHIA